MNEDQNRDVNYLFGVVVVVVVGPACWWHTVVATVLFLLCFKDFQGYV